MYILIWEFHAKPGREDEFERVYGPKGEWAKLFRRGEGYLGTPMLHDAKNPRRYLTVDCWASQTAYENFRQKWPDEYRALDERCKALTEQEKFLGGFEKLDFESLANDD